MRFFPGGVPLFSRRQRWLVRLGGMGLFLLMLPGCVSQMFYYPTKAWQGTPDQYKLTYRDVAFKSADGTVLSGWFMPAQNGPAKGTVIHFHGNAQNMSHHLAYTWWLAAAGYNLFTFDYRGYGKSEGKEGRAGIYADSLAALRFARTLPGIDPDRLIVLGQSLGGSNAIAVLGREKVEGVRAVIIDSSFFSYRSIVKDKIAGIPILAWIRGPLSYLVIGNGFSPGPVADQMPPVPKLLIHGTADRVIPVSHGEALFAKFTEPKTLIKKEGGRHTDALVEDEYRMIVLKFLEQALKDAP